MDLRRMEWLPAGIGVEKQEERVMKEIRQEKTTERLNKG